MRANGRKYIYLSAIFGVCCVIAGQVRAQTLPPKPPANSQSTEKAITVKSNVTIKIPCVEEGKIVVNGWNRDEVRVLIRDGSDFDFKVNAKDPESGKALWLLIVAGNGAGTNCLSGDLIEIDAPSGASFDLTGKVAETVVDSIAKAKITNIEGSIVLRNITGGIVAATYQGDVRVEDSSGEISLESSSGNVVAFQVGPGQIGDLLKAKTTNGAILLRAVNHRQIDANSISGSVSFEGSFLNGGLYNFRTSNGAVRLTIPADSSCKITASYGFGSFATDLDLKYLSRNNDQFAKKLSATIGAGDGTVNVVTNSGHISIRKPQP